MRKERNNRINVTSDKEQPILTQLMGNCKSPKSALVTNNAKFKAMWAQNFSYREAGSKCSKESIIVITIIMYHNYEPRGVR